MANAKLTVELAADSKNLKQELKAIREQERAQNKAAKIQVREADKQYKAEKKRVADVAKLKEKHHKDLVRKQTMDRRQQERHEKTIFQNQVRQEKKLADERKRERMLESRAEREADRRKSRAMRAGKSILRAGAGVAAGLAGYFVGAVTGAYGKRNEFHQAMGQNIGLGSGKRIRAGVSGARGSRLGFDNIETAAHNRAMANATGVLGPRELQQGMRATGMDAGNVSSIYSSFRKAGTSFAGGEFKGQSKGGREFAKMISAGMESGLEKGRLPEFAEGVTNILSQRGGVASGDVSPGGIAAQLAALGRTGLAGFQGERGANMMAKIDSSFSKTGGGEWGDNFMRMAMGFGRPGSGVGFYEAERQREKGTADPANMSKLLGEVVSQYGAGKEGALGLRELTGVSLDQAEQLLKIHEEGGLSNDKLDEIGKVMEASKPLAEQSLTAMKDIGGTLVRLAGRTNTLIGIGERVAPEIEKIEDWQFQLIKALLDIKDVIKSFYEDARAFFMAPERKDAVKAIAELDKKRQAALDNARGKTPAQLAAEAAKSNIDMAAAGKEFARSEDGTKLGRVAKVVGKGIVSRITGVVAPGVGADGVVGGINKLFSSDDVELLGGTGSRITNAGRDSAMPASIAALRKQYGMDPNTPVTDLELRVMRNSSMLRATGKGFTPDVSQPNLHAPLADKLRDEYSSIKVEAHVPGADVRSRPGRGKVNRNNAVTGTP